MKAKKILLWFFIVLLTAIVIDIIYLAWFANGVSATIPSIQTYSYYGNAELIVKDLKSYQTANRHLNIEIIDTLGDKQTGLGYEIIVKYIRETDGDTLRYHLKCVEDAPANTTAVKIIGAHNLNNNTGGYGLKVKGMNVLLNDFNTFLIDSLKDRYGLTLKEDKQK